jgi:hypothetical protein
VGFIAITLCVASRRVFVVVVVVYFVIDSVRKLFDTLSYHLVAAVGLRLGVGEELHMGHISVTGNRTPLRLHTTTEHDSEHL